MTQPLIEVSGLQKNIGPKHIISNISWSVYPGEQWALFGLNGCGKTTLLSILAGFQMQSSGYVRILGEEYTAENVFALRRKIGLISSSFFGKIFSGESVLHVALSGLGNGLVADKDIPSCYVKTAKHFLADFHLANHLDLPFNCLSKGEQQNVLIIRALLSQPRILLLDELTSGLDVVARQSILQYLNELCKCREITLINVTHYPSEINDFYTHCLLLRRGECYAQGLCNEIFTVPILNEFLQQPYDLKTTNHDFTGSVFSEFTKEERHD